MSPAPEVQCYKTGDRVWVADWAKGSTGSQFREFGGGDPDRHKGGLRWIKGTIVFGDCVIDECEHTLVNSTMTVRLDRTSWFQFYRRVVSVHRRRIRSFSVLEQLADV